MPFRTTFDNNLKRVCNRYELLLMHCDRTPNLLGGPLFVGPQHSSERLQLGASAAQRVGPKKRLKASSQRVYEKDLARSSDQAYNFHNLRKTLANCVQSRRRTAERRYHLRFKMFLSLPKSNSNLFTNSPLTRTHHQNTPFEHTI